MVLAGSRRIPRAPRYSGAAFASVMISPTGLSPAAVTFSTVFGYHSIGGRRRSYNPSAALTGLVWATARSLATTCAIVVYFLFLRVLRCFSSPRSPHDHMVSPSPVTGFPIRTSAGHSAFAAHRRFSQLVTSFVASESHRHPPCALVRFSFIFTANSSDLDNSRDRALAVFVFCRHPLCQSLAS